MENFLQKHRKTLSVCFSVVCSVFLVAVVVSAATVIGANIDTAGNITASAGNLSVAGTATLSGTLLTSGSSTFSSTLGIVGTASSSNIRPWTNNSKDIGRYAYAFRDVYASGTIFSSHLTTGDITATTTLAVNGNTTLGDDATADTVTLNSRLASSLIPSAGNTRDLGSTSSSLAMRSIYASSTLAVGGLSATTTVNLGTAGGMGKGTCIILTSSDGTLLYVSVTSTPASQMRPWEALAISTASCL